MIVSTSPDFAATGSQCDPLSDATQVPEESMCDLTGQYCDMHNRSAAFSPKHPKFPKLLGDND